MGVVLRIYIWKRISKSLKSVTLQKKTFTSNNLNSFRRLAISFEYDLIRELRSHIQTLQSEVHFLREELKEKSVLLRSLIITSNNQRNKRSEKTPENPLPNFPSKDDSNNIKKQVPPIKDDITDFCVEGTAIKCDNTKKENQFKKKIS